jgi:hypothetical protein
VRCASWPDPLDAIAAAGFETWALTPSPTATALFELEVPDRVAIVAGAEGPGLTEAALARVDTHVRIPMLGSKHSLNVATAGGVVIYELLRKYRELCSPRRRRDAETTKSLSLRSLPPLRALLLFCLTLTLRLCVSAVNTVFCISSAARRSPRRLPWRRSKSACSPAWESARACRKAPRSPR